MYGRESIVLDKIYEMKILMDLHVLKNPESENYIFIGWFLCVCVCVCTCLYVVISKTQKEITVETSSLVFYICIICKCYQKNFNKNYV